MTTPAALAQVLPGRKKPSPRPDSVLDGVPFRGSRYAEEFNTSLVPKNHLLADEGSYFVTMNPTPGTGIAAAASNSGIPTLGANTDTRPVLAILNGAQPSDGIRVYLDALQLLVTAAGDAAGTRIDFAVQLDNWQNRVKPGAAVGGTQCTPINPNMDDGTKSVAQVWFGANTVIASSNLGSARLLCRRQLRPVIPVVGDVYAMTFGGAEQFVGSLIPNGTAMCQQSFNLPPIILGPEQVALIYLWLASQGATGTSYEFDLTHWER
jgi:hypothetical protein